MYSASLFNMSNITFTDSINTNVNSCEYNFAFWMSVCGVLSFSIGFLLSAYLTMCVLRETNPETIENDVFSMSNSRVNDMNTLRDLQHSHFLDMSNMEANDSIAFDLMAVSDGESHNEDTQRLRL